MEADSVFEKKKDAFEIRRQFHTDEVQLYCCECHQKLNVSTSKYDRLHFKHQKASEYCILKDDELSPAQLDEIIEILKSKESDRHKYLKNEIAKRLAQVDGIDTSSIAIDNRFITRGAEKRRPDVYCKYKDKEIVFEIQLSQLSLRYIINRHDFYKAHGIYLIWILDNFDLQKQSQLERDIKYLTTHQNFFKFDEQVTEFRMLCEYKLPFLTYDNNLHTKWVTQSVSLEELQFDETARQVFFFDFGEKLKKQEHAKKIRDQELNEIERARREQLKAEEQKQAAAARRVEIENRASEVKNEIKRLRAMHAQVYTSAYNLLHELGEDEITYFNATLKLSALDRNGNPVFYGWLSSARQEDIAFIEFLMTCPYIEFDVNFKSQANISAFQVIIQNEHIGNDTSIKALFRKGYIFTTEDETYLRSVKEGYELEADILIYKICSALNDRRHVEKVFEHSKLICILESVRQQKVIGFRYKPTEWVAFANNAAEYYGAYWEYIETVFRHFGLWHKLIVLDKKGTFQKKVNALYGRMPKQDFSFDLIFQALFPEFGKEDHDELSFMSTHACRRLTQCSCR